MYINAANHSHKKKSVSNQNVSHNAQNVPFNFTPSLSANNQDYLNSNRSAFTDTSNNIHSSTVSLYEKNMLPFHMYPNNSAPFVVNTDNSVNLTCGNNVYPMLPQVTTRMPPPMLQNIPLHQPPPKLSNSFSNSHVNGLYNQSRAISTFSHTEIQMKDNGNCQQSSFPNQSVSHYGQNMRFQCNSSVLSQNQNCTNPNQIQNLSMPETTHVSNVTANIKNVFSSPVCGNNLIRFPANENNSISIPYGNNIRSAFSFAPRMPPPVVQNINLNLSPPVLKTEPVVSSNHIPLNAISTYDKEATLTDFISRFIKKGESNGNTVKIPVYRTTLKAAFLKLKELLHHKCTLEGLLHEAEDSWKSEMQIVSTLQNELSEICQLVSAPHLLNCVLKKLKIIKRKREQKKRTKINILCAKRKKELKRKELHEEIDKWLDSIKEKNLKIKRETEMKKEADFILLEVRRKIYEAKRTIEKIKVFEKLRQARQSNSVKKGLHILPEHDKSFEKKVSVLKKTMVKQLADYEAEENALKVMLETEQEGQLSFMIQLRKTLQEKKQNHIMECLFGNSGDPLPTDSLYLFHQYHTVASSSMENLLQIRRQWDIYLADDGEAIPQQWVVPTSTNNSWRKWLVKNKRIDV